jgi:AcrR family transcriptional regulator
MVVYGVDLPASTKDRIVALARNILVEDGAEAVSMRRVAAAAGITPMAIYRHYPGRQGLLDRVAELSFAELAASWEAKPRPPDARGRVAEGMRDLLDFALAQPQLYRYLFIEQRPSARHFPEDFRSGGSPTMNLLVVAIEDGIRAGAFHSDDAWEVALTAAALAHGLIGLYQVGRIRLSEPEFRDLFASSMGRLLDGMAR